MLFLPFLLNRRTLELKVSDMFFFLYIVYVGIIQQYINKKMKNEIQEYPNKPLKHEFIDKLEDNKVIIKVDETLFSINGLTFFSWSSDNKFMQYTKLKQY
jgi:hypothetical protein